MKHHTFLILTATIALTSIANADTTITRQGQTTYRIVVAKNAPESVQAAARELQESLRLATGATLVLQEDTATPSSPYISLGETSQAKAAGLAIAQVKEDGFRILTRNGNLYITGPDTAEGQWTKNGGTSSGTANGVYTFLEDYLGVRWLMPGDIGRDVPRKEMLTIPDIDRTATPRFIFRRMPHIARSTEDAHRARANDWGRHQKLGSSIQINYNHNWTHTVPPEMFDTHPEWFAMRDGKRVRPTPGSQYSLESTNQELVKYFASKAIESIKKFDRPNTFSLSPSDGRGWSQSPESLALYDPVPPGRDHPGMGSLVLKWYHDVASIVAKEYPEGRLAGYIYSDYVFPPTKIDMKLPDNFTPMLCGIGSYGYQLYKPANREQWTRVMEAWTKVAPENWFYYDLPNQLWNLQQSNDNVPFTGNTANVTPPAPDILNFIFRGLEKADIKGATIFSDPAWSNSAVANYIIAKLLWDPSLDARTLQTEWLQRAYGDAAVKPMTAFYDKLDSAFRDYYTKTTEGHRLTDGMLQEIYAAHYDELEKLLLEVKKQPMNATQRERFTLFENNFIVLQWRLRNGKFLPADFKSAYQRSDREIAEIIEKPNPDLSAFPGVVPLRSSSKSPSLAKLKIKKAAVATALPKGSSPNNLLNQHTFMIYAARNGKVRIMPQNVEHGSMFAAFFVMSRRAGTVASGILVPGRAIEFDGQAGQDYYLYIAPRKKIGYQLLVENAAASDAGFDSKSGTYTFQDKKATFYVAGDEQKIKPAPGGVVIATAADLETTQQQFIKPQVINLDNQWKFLPEEASGTAVYRNSFDDASWATINANDHWQNQGFKQYNGKAWYRKQFSLPAGSKPDKVVLHFSGVDGTAVVFLNGKRLGSHRVAADGTGWDDPFSFDITAQLQPGNNLIAIQVASKSLNTAAGIHRPVNLVVGQGR